MTKKSIKTKVMSLILSFTIVALFILGAVSVSSMFEMRGRIKTQNSELGEKASSESQETFVTQMKSQLSTLSNGIADTTDEKLKIIQNQTKIVASQASFIYSHPDLYKNAAADVDYLQENQVGKFTLHIKTAEGVSKQSIQNELNMVSNLSDLLCQVNTLDLSINASYIGTQSGFQLSADKDPQGPNNKSFPVTERGWYTGAVKACGIYWTDVFVDVSANRTSINCSAPFYDVSGSKKVLKGVACSAATLNSIQNIISRSGVGKTGKSFIVDKLGNIIITTDEMTVKDGKVEYVNLLKSKDNGVAAAAKNMTNGKNGVEEITLNGKKVFAAYTPLKTTGWCMVTVIDVDEVMQPGNALAATIQQKTQSTIDELNSHINFVLWLFIVLFFLFIILSSIASSGFAGRLTKPVIGLTENVRTISSGNLDIKVDKINTGDEIEVLSNSIDKMTVDLKTYIANFTAVTAEKERIGAELDVASKIQSSMLPSTFPAFPNRKEFGVYASMQAAKEVGGDFYDFFLIDSNHLAVVIADVSGKGVPAALFMVIAKTMIKNHAQLNESAENVFTNVNALLCENNDAGMFVTAWMGILEIDSGKFIYVNAGHNPPLLCRANGNYEYLKGRAGFVLAGMENMKYHQQEMQLNKGDRLFLYTDGVTEATDANNELFGDDRLEKSLNECCDISIKETIDHVHKSIDEFVGEADQFDDITMLSLKYGEKE